MPSNQAVAREAQLVKAVARWLREQGVPCTVLGWPDRERDPCSAGLTVEAVLAVGADAAKMDWAVDVMTVPVPPGVSAGMAEARQHIQPDAAALAGAAHRAITIGIRIPAGSPADRKAYYKHVLELVEEALQTGDEYYDASDPETQVLLSDDEFIGDPDRTGRAGGRPPTSTCSRSSRKHCRRETSITMRAIRRPRFCSPTTSSSVTRPDPLVQYAFIWARS